MKTLETVARLNIHQYPWPTTEINSIIGGAREELAEHYKTVSGKITHESDCATSCAPAKCPQPCDCNGENQIVPPPGKPGAAYEELVATIDMLGVALAGHNHQWTPAERAAYDRSTA